jgi:hypothetical protein
LDEERNWVVPGHCALVLAPEKLSNGKTNSKNRSRVRAR